MNRLLLQWTYRRTVKGSSRTNAKDANTLVRIPQDLLAFDVRLRQPPLGELVPVLLLYIVLT